jgi:thioredoxin-related protein
MPKVFAPRLETISNIAVITAALLLGVVLVRREFFPPSEPSSARQLQGTTIQAAYLGTSATPRKLILAISETCRFCEQEMPFYKQLSALQSELEFSLLAIFPKNEPVPERFLSERAVSVNEVLSADFAHLGVKGTPTILLLDARGRVLRAWVGALSSLQHEEVVAALRAAS